MITGAHLFAAVSPRTLLALAVAATMGTALILVPSTADAGLPLTSLQRLEGRVLRSIRVRAPPDVPRADLERLIGLEVGAPLQLPGLQAAVERLFQIDRFRSVVARGRPTDDGGVILEFLLEPRLELTSFEIRASGEVARNWVEAALGVARGDEVDERQLPELQARLRAALLRRGWRAPAIGLALTPLDDAGHVELLVRIDAGPPTRLAQVRLRGRVPIPRWRLDVGVESGEVLRLDRVEEALGALAKRLRGQGYFDADIAPPLVEPRPSSDAEPRADLVVEVDPGPRVEVRFEGNHRVSRARLAEDTQVLEELGSGPAALLEVRERLLARYERLGYDRAQVEAFGRTSADGLRRQVLFRIQEGPPTVVVDIRFEGTDHLDDATLRAQVGETVQRFLAPALGRPGVDPQVVDEVLRGPGTVEQARRRPSTAPPDAAKVYVPRAYRAGTDAIADLYRSEGFQTVEVGDPRVRQVAPGSVELIYPVREGVRWMVGSVAFSGHEGVPGADLLAAVGLWAEPGPSVPLAFDTVEEGRRSLLQLYQDRGYLFAVVREELREVPERGALGGRFFSPRTDMAAICAEAGRECAVEIAYRIEEGPLVRTRDIIVRGLAQTRLSVVEGEILLRPGKVLSDSDMVRTRDNLVRLGVFERVVVRPIEEERAATVKDVLVEVRERDNLSLELGVGASTEEGLRVFAAFADRNLLGTALRLQTNAKVNLWAEPLLSIYDESLQAQIRDFYQPFSVFGGRPLLLLEFEIAAGVSYPRIFLLPDGFSFGLDVVFLRDYDPAFAEENFRVTLIGNYEGFKPRILGRNRPLALQLRLNFETTQLDCNTLEGREDLCSSGVAAGNLGDRTEGQNTYLSLGPRLSWDFRDDPLDPSRGAYFELEGELAKGLDQLSPDYVRFEGRASAYAPVAPRVTFFASFRGGRIFGLGDGLEIPLNRRFYAGGRSTIRGYPEKTLLPQDVPLNENGDPVSNISNGGVVYLVFKTELRVQLVSPVSLAGFFDIGDLWRLTGGGGQCESTGVRFVTECTLPNGTVERRRLAKGGGFGLRVATPIGPLSVDMGFPIDVRDPAVEPWTLHFSVGSF